MKKLPPPTKDGAVFYAISAQKIIIVLVKDKMKLIKMFFEVDVNRNFTKNMENPPIKRYYGLDTHQECTYI